MAGGIDRMGKTRAEFIAECRTWIGTPFGHQGRTKGLFVDCIGAPQESAKALGLLPADFDFRRYGMLPVPAQMEKGLDELLERVPPGQEKPGDIAWMSDLYIGGAPRHLAVLSELGTIIHAHSRAGSVEHSGTGKVVEQRLTPEFRGRIVRFYRLRGIKD
jgi:hypothetical protein